jgi:hypothetical protein
MACYYSGAGNGSNCFEIYDKDRLQPEIELLQNSAEEMVNTMGQKINYYVNTMTTTSADVIYGEQPTSVYHGPLIIKMMIELNETSLQLSKFGFNSDDEVTGYMSYNGFVKAVSGDGIYQTLDHSIEPKSGDVFQMYEYGNTREGGRAGNYFQITERRDQDISGNMNPLGGHYGWRIKAKRMEYSFEPGLSGESVNQQVTDDAFYGKVESTITGEVSSAPKSYTSDVDEISKEKVLDMSLNDTNIYGTYDLN